VKKFMMKKKTEAEPKEERKEAETNQAAASAGERDEPRQSPRTGQGAPLEVLAYGTAEMLCRPCVDCGLYTGRYCDYCTGASRIPSEQWAAGQMTPLCSHFGSTNFGRPPFHPTSCRPFV